MEVQEDTIEVEVQEESVLCWTWPYDSRSKWLGSFI